jgi:hypothetical protein
LSDVTLSETSTNNVFSASGDLLDLLSLLPPPADAIPDILSQSVNIPGIGDVGYTLASADLTGGLELAQKFTFEPTAVDVTLTLNGAEKQSGTLGNDFTFTAPSNLTGPLNLSATYSLVGNLVSQTGVVGNVSLDLSALSAELGPVTFGPLASKTFSYTSSPSYLINNTFSLSGFNTISDTYTIPLASDSTSNAAAADPVTIAAGATVELSSAFAGSVTFAGSSGTLQLDNSSSFTGTVAGMTGNDTIDLEGIKFTNQQPTYSPASGTLTVTEGTHSANIALLGNYLASSFVASSDGHGGTNIVDPSLIASNQQTLLTQPHHT